jgi:Flp pilus assembly pilin Flp
LVNAPSSLSKSLCGGAVTLRTWRFQVVTIVAPRFESLSSGKQVSPFAVRCQGVLGMTKGGETHMTFYSYLTELIAGIRRREEGQTMAEYGVILAVITVAIIAALVALSTGIFDNLMSVADVLN